MHYFEVVMHPRTDGLFHSALCSCGWSGDLFREPFTARRSGSSHLLHANRRVLQPQ